MEAAPHPWPALGVLLLRDGLVSKDELEEILAQQHDNRQQRVSGRRLGELLIQRGRVSPSDIAKLVAEQYELPFMELEVADVDVRAALVLREEDARRLSSLPVLRRPDGTYLLAIADPSTVLFSEELRELLGSVPRFAVVGPDAIEQAIDFVYAQDAEPYPPLAAAEDPVDALILNFPSGGPVIVPPVEEPVGPMPRARPFLGTLLVRDGLISDADLEAALAQQRITPSYRLGEILVEQGFVSQGVVARLVAEQYELPFVDLEVVDLVPAVAALLDEEVARRLSAVPIESHEDGSLDVAIADPTSAVYSDELQRALDRHLSFVVASPDAIERVLDRVHGSIATEVNAEPVADYDLSAFEELVQAFESVPSIPDAEHETESPDDETTEPPVLEVAVEPADDFAPVEQLGWAERLQLVDEVAFEDDDPSEREDGPAPSEGWPLEDETADSHSAPSTAEIASVEVEVQAVEVVLAETAAFEDERAAETAMSERDGEAEPPLVSLPELPDLLGLEPEAPTADETTERAELVEAFVETEPDVDQAVDAELDADGVQPAPELDVFAFDIFSISSGPATLEPESETSEVDPDPVAAFEPVEVELPPVLAEEPAFDLEREVAAVVASGATVLHLSPQDHDSVLVRARVDGMLRTVGTAPVDECTRLVADLSASEVMRAYSTTTPRGEKTTIFVSRDAETAPTLDTLGEGADLATLVEAIERPTGLVLVCGPAGSGVTTTLYAAVEHAAADDRVSTTIEDAIERVVPGVDHVELDPSRGETYETALRRLRFFDSDVVLLGALPDRDAAELAFRAADHGHLVLAGFRATGAVDALERLVADGLPTHLVASSLSCVVSQRLVRTNCAECRETYYASDDELLALRATADSGPRLLARGRGCEACGGSGFRGRTAVFEVLPFTAELRELVAGGASAKKVRRAARAAGMKTLHEEAARLCLEGQTTVAEIERVLG